MSKVFRKVEASRHAVQTVMPLTNLTDNMKPSSSSKELIKLAAGDPTLDGNLKIPEVLEEEAVEALRSMKYNGYPPVIGYGETRDAVAEYWHKFVGPERRKHVVGENVIIASGASHGIVLAITAICNEGDNLLFPTPGFPHYETVCNSYGFECRPYRCDFEKDWEVDLDHVRSLVNDRTRGILLTNPSNPSGSNFSRKHLENVARLCEELQLPIISDETYAEVVFKGEEFVSAADLNTNVPRVVIGSIAKFCIAPGWRLGWNILVDPTNVARDWFSGMDNLAQLHVGANSIAQMAFTKGISKVKQSHIDHLVSVLEEGAQLYKPLIDLGFKYSLPRASMFVTIKIDFSRFADIANDMDFYEKLLDEENVQVLPGCIFGLTGFFRSTISRPAPVIQEAIGRIQAFCARHSAQ